MKRKLAIGAGAVFGIFAFWVVVVVLASAVVASRVPVSLPPSMQIQATGDYIFARGTWIIEGEKQAFPLQTSEIQCDKQLGRCTVATAEVGFGHQLYVDLSSYDVTEWGPSRVVFVDTAPICVSYIYTVDILTQLVNGVRKKRDNKPDQMADCGALKDELRLSLRDGFPVWNALQEEAMPWFGALALAPLKLFQ